ncbi:DUF411 domain-containing protein [Roseovarius sp.]|uniref:DUF411 domain-containing protein n=1 Tax=Roseovarius sp. TaxID=1486281 RepID=UPI003B5C630F
MQSRRRFLAGAAGALGTAPLAARVRADVFFMTMHVMRDPFCGCCDAWIEFLREEGLQVTSQDSFGTLLSRYKVDNGIPEQMVSCHTAKFDGYVIEGPVPTSDIMRLLEERPVAVGLATPGVSCCLPESDPEKPREGFDVHLILRDGSTKVFARYADAGSAWLRRWRPSPSTSRALCG